MTHITVAHAAGRWRVRAEGHASGSPEACAGVSALLYALAGWLANAPEGVRRECVSLAPGAAELVFSGGPAAAAAAELVAVGLAQIAKAVPEAVAADITGISGAEPEAAPAGSPQERKLNPC